MSLPAGTQLGGLEILRPLGAGGMGEVYLARDSDLNRSVAVKVLPPDVTSDPQRVARFEQEARAASALNHPNVCVIHALGRTEDGRRYIAMEHVEGETLRARLGRGRLPLAEALDVAIQIASALTAAHAAGIVHRDIKPENVMIRRDRLVKVLDFGLAKLSASGLALAAHEPTRTMAVTDPGSLVGTVGYMSPEQARGADVDARTDIWALGVVLYEMVTGRAPFTGASRSDVLVAILDRDPAALSQLLPDAPQELQRIVRKCLRKDADARYQVVKDLLLDLEALRDEVSNASASRSSDATVATVPGHRRRRWATAAAAVIVLIAATTAGVGWWMRRPAPPPATATSAPVDRPLRRITFDPGLQTDVAFSPDGRSIAYASDRSGNFDIWIQSLEGGEPRQVTRSSAPERQPSWSPDGKSLAYRAEGEAHGLFVVPVAGGAPRHLASAGMYPQWSADGSEVIYRSGYHDLIVDVYSVSPEGGDTPRKLGGGFLDGGSWQWIAPHPDGRISAAGIHAKGSFGFFTISRDGRQVTTSRVRDDFPLRFWSDAATLLVRFQWDRSGAVLFVEAALNDVRNVWKIRVDPASLEWLSAERLTVGAGPDTAAALSPDGSRLAFTTQRESIRLWSYSFDAARGRLDPAGTPISPDGGQVEGFALSPDGRRIAYLLRQAGSDQPTTWLTDLDAGTSESLGGFMTVAWARNNRTIAYAFYRPNRPPPGEWALAIREIGGAERIVTGWSDKSVLLPTDWTPDGRALLGLYLEPLFTGISKVVIRPVSPPGPDRVVIAHPNRYIWQPSFSPDGRWLSFVSQPVDDRTRIEMAVAPAHGAPRDQWVRIAPDHRWVDKPRWAPDGRTLYFISSGRGTFPNLWGVRFDGTRGQPLGEPFQVTQFDSPGFVIGPSIITAELGIAPGRVVLQMATITGNIWMLDGVSR